MTRVDLQLTHPRSTPGKVVASAASKGDASQDNGNDAGDDRTGVGSTVSVSHDGSVCFALLFGPVAWLSPS